MELALIVLLIVMWIFHEDSSEDLVEAVEGLTRQVESLRVAIEDVAEGLE